MSNLYVKIWVDAIMSFREHHPDRKDWKSTLLLFISWMNSLNLWVIFLWLKYFKIFDIPLLKINIFPGNVLNSYLAFTIQFALPFVLINYLFVFHKARYKKLLKISNNLKKRYAPIYSFASILSAFLSFIIYGILT